MADEVSELMLFVKIVQAGNLSAAARTLNASTAAMSRTLSSLESRLGVRLVTRTSRTFQLTEEGDRFYERCQRIVADIKAAEAEASEKTERVRGTLHVGAPSEIGRRLVAPLIGEFTSKFPEVEARMILSDAGLDVIDDGLDVALRIGLPNDTSVIARKILTAKRIVCASPAYFKRHGTPAHPDDLRRHNCIRLMRGKRVMDSWLFQEDGKPFEVKVNGTLTTSSGEVVHDWVRAGRGIALKANWDLGPELEEGSIVQCLEQFWCDPIDLFAITANRMHQPHRIRLFLDFIAKKLPLRAVREVGRRDKGRHDRDQTHRDDAS
ncbi:LysR family transcriptional regulator [Silvibacterium sp.]|uniref:LysR family transcriptional regulator n=1 Tax=Silvibacterium sp. TaxID=1964179 RepID=UPI0039E2A02C